MKTNTSKTEPAPRAISTAQIEQEFEQVGQLLRGQPRKTVRIPPDSYASDTVELGYNGRMFLIRRGENVTLPMPLIEILERSGIL